MAFRITTRAMKSRNGLVHCQGHCINTLDVHGAIINKVQLYHSNAQLVTIIEHTGVQYNHPAVPIMSKPDTLPKSYDASYTPR